MRARRKTDPDGFKFSEAILPNRPDPMEAPGTVRCGIEGCRWTSTGTLAEGVSAHKAHRSQVHGIEASDPTPRPSIKHGKVGRPRSQNESRERRERNKKRLRKMEEALRERAMSSARLGQLLGMSGLTAAGILSWARKNGESEVTLDRKGGMWSLPLTPRETLPAPDSEASDGWRESWRREYP